MYAVIESGGKQHRVELGSEIQVDRLDVRPGDAITLERVLLVADGDAAAIGQPVVDGATVSAEVVAQKRGQKIVVFKYKPKARTRVKQGFRAELTTLRITDIAFGGKSAAKDADKARKDEEKRAREEEKAQQAAAAKAVEEKAAADQELAAKLAASEEQPPEPADQPSDPQKADGDGGTTAAAKEPAPEAEQEAEQEAEGLSADDAPPTSEDDDASKKDE